MYIAMIPPIKSLIPIHTGGSSSPWVLVFFPKLIVTYLLAGSAFLFYISDFPERFFPGRFDYVGHAHQWWHVLIVGALYYWHQAGITFMKKRLAESCYDLGGGSSEDAASAAAGAVASVDVGVVGAAAAALPSLFRGVANGTEFGGLSADQVFQHL